MKDLGKTIESQLEILDMTQTELGNKVGVDQRTISKYVNNRAQPPLDVLAKICNILEININYILEVPEYKHIYLNDKNEAILLETYRKLDDNNRRTLIKLSKALLGK